MKAVLVPLLLAATVASAADELPKLGVLDFQPNGASEQLASAASGVAANEVGRLGLFKVITSEAIRNLLAIERQKQLMGCTEKDCMAELSGALGIEYALSGKVSRIEGKGGMPTTFTLELTLLNVLKSRTEGTDVQTAQSEAELMGKVGRGVAKVLSKILEGRSGFLVVAASETGAVVKLDDVVVGTTPLTGRLTVPGGPHFLIVEKAGFVAWQRQLKIDPAQLTEETVTLIPSGDYVKEYEARNGRMRLGAWLATGVAVLGVGAAGYLQWDASRTFGAADLEGTFAYHQAKLRAGIETEEGVNHRTEAVRLASSIQSMNTFTYVSAGVGAAAAVAATYFFIAGDDPGRYAKYRTTDVKVSLVPSQGGAFAAISGAF